MRKFLVIVGVVAASLLLTSPAAASQGGAYLKNGDLVCTDQARSDTGSATASVTWFIFGTDQDYAFVGLVFSTTGSTVDTVFTPGPELSLIEMCFQNNTGQTVSGTFDLSPA